MALNTASLLIERNATYTFGDGTSSLSLKVTPYSFSATPMGFTKANVPDHNGGLYAVTNEGKQREPWTASISGKCIDWGETGSGEETARKVFDALRDDHAVAIDGSTPWTSTNPLTGGGVFMLDFTIVVTNAGGETVTISCGAVYVNDYSITSAEGGFEYNLNISGVEQWGYAAA